MRDPNVLSDRKTCDLLYAALYTIAENLNPQQKPLDPEWVIDIAHDVAQAALRTATRKNLRYRKLENKYHVKF